MLVSVSSTLVDHGGGRFVCCWTYILELKMNLLIYSLPASVRLSFCQAYNLIWVRRLYSVLTSERARQKAICSIDELLMEKKKKKKIASFPGLHHFWLPSCKQQKRGRGLGRSLTTRKMFFVLWRCIPLTK